MGNIIDEKSKMVVEISKICNLNSDSSIDLIITLKSLFDRDALDVIDKYLQINDRKDIRIKIYRKDDMSIVGNPEEDNLPYVKRYRVDRENLPF
jgi:hypothetical protein